MAHYVDGYVLPMPKRKLKFYQKIAQKASKVWLDHGALDYRECALDHAEIKPTLPFTRGIRSKPGETIIFAYVVFKSRAHRDKVNAKVMKDPRLNEMCDPKDMPFDCKRMMYGGFKTIVGK